ncbi:MAG: fructokinase [Chloroflexaceae bacterium]|nr:fructokinase [Chloroflexaceae bacterium]
MSRIAALGEMLVDLVATAAGVTLTEAPSFAPAAGGAPANVAVGVARLGGKGSFLGKFGDDPWGHFLSRTLEENGVDIQGIRFTGEARTALAFVALMEHGERDFVFYRHPSADMLYAPDEVDAAVIAGATILHHGSISLITEPSRSATLRAIDLARQHGCLISYDPNLRLPLWPDEATARTTILETMPGAHYAKVSEDELTFLTGETEVLRGAERLWHADMRLLSITRGSGGCSYVAASGSGHVDGFSVQCVDTTGAGDGWVAALLTQLAQNPDLWADRVALEQALRYANAAGALTTTKRGAIPALPTPDQIDALMRTAGVMPVTGEFDG